MFLREAGVDISVIALWPGHESIASTQIDMHADQIWPSNNAQWIGAHPPRSHFEPLPTF
jgi:lambda repressor-like predicted transcriptional regulator